MDASAIGRFHSTVAVLPGESMDVPAGGLARFLQQNLRFKVFLVAISVLEDRWATRTRSSLTARDLHEARVCVRIIVDHMVCASNKSVSSLILKLIPFLVLHRAHPAERVTSQLQPSQYPYASVVDVLSHRRAAVFGGIRW